MPWKFLCNQRESLHTWFCTTAVHPSVIQHWNGLCGLNYKCVCCHFFPAAISQAMCPDQAILYGVGNLTVLYFGHFQYLQQWNSGLLISSEVLRHFFLCRKGMMFQDLVSQMETDIRIGIVGIFTSVRLFTSVRHSSHFISLIFRKLGSLCPSACPGTVTPFYRNITILVSHSQLSRRSGNPLIQRSKGLRLEGTAAQLLGI